MMSREQRLEVVRHGVEAVRVLRGIAPAARGLHSLTSELNLRTFGNASLTLELNLSTFGTHPRFNWVI